MELSHLENGAEWGVVDADLPKQTISNSTGELSSKSKRKCLQVGVVVHIV